jgi:hypothetical protein
MRVSDSLQAIVSCGRLQADRAQKRVEVGDDALIESVESVALIFRDGRPSAATGRSSPAVTGA